VHTDLELVELLGVKLKREAIELAVAAECDVHEALSIISAS
jgi:hypothetical protein